MSEIDDLRAMVIAQGRALSELRDEMAFHRGIDSAQSSIYSPHPNISISTGEFGGGVMRLDSNGMQVVTGGVETPAVYFLKEFSSNPRSELAYVEITGLADYSGSASTLFIRRILDGDTTGLLTLGNGSALAYGSARVLIFDGYVKIDNAASAGVPLWLGPMTADPASPQDGMILYRSDTDKARLRADGTTHNIATETWVTAGFIAAGVPILGSGSELTIASGVVTATSGYHRIDTQSDDASDELDTINGLTTGQVIVIRAENAGRTVVIKNGTGNLQLDGATDFSLDDVQDTWTGIYDGTNVLEISRSDNG